ncbi:S41 family peptidase [Candidatus Nomurabacteria bacterium]|nr:S41 family peptidase [Candidatus Nomurabacteria bacterium]
MKNHSSSRRGVSSQTGYIILILVAMVAFVAGTRSDEIYKLVGPALGIKVVDELDLSSVQQTYKALAQRYTGSLDLEKLIYGANRGLVSAAGDRYTVFLDPNEASELDKDLSGDIGGGIGAEIGIRKDRPTIVRLLADNPAIGAGLAVGDAIISVNDKPTKEWDAEKTAKEIRGEIGSSVKLMIDRAGKQKTYSITRAKVNNPSVYSEVRNGIGVMTITRFDEDTGLLARKEADSFMRRGVRGVVVDVRNDGGGYLDAAVDVAGLWLDNKLVVTQKTKGKTADSIKSPAGDAILSNLPTIVLVNQGTASASEILAGALRDHGKAKLAGEKTFGKGSVQEVIDLSGGSRLKVTISKWYTPKNHNVDSKGLTPDTAIELSDDDVSNGYDNQLDVAIKQLTK